MEKHINIDPKSGFCKSNSIFYSKRKPVALPATESLDITTFISAQAHHGTTAYIDASTGTRLTFNDVWKSIESVSSWLYDFGIRKGDVVLLLSPNSIHFPIVCLSVMSIGAIISTTNPINTVNEINKQIVDSKPAIVFTVVDLLPKLVGSNLPIVVMDSGTGTRLDSISNVVSNLEDIIKEVPRQQRVKERVNRNDPATLLYSSGTTGLSKGVISTHGNLIAMVPTIAKTFKLQEGQQTFLCTIPMFHVYGLVVFVLGLIAYGETIVVLPKFNIEKMLSAVETYKVNYVPVVPPVLVTLVNNAEQIRGKYDLRSMKWVMCGGASLSKELIERFMKMYSGVTIIQGYALTESTGTGGSTDTIEESKRYGAVGRLAPSMEAKIVDPESGIALPANKVGELWLKGPTIMKGYFNNTEATSSTLDSNGWLRTGDLCYIDEDGFLFVVDRLKELIKYNGYQVPPAELEALLLTHPEIDDCGVIPFPDKNVGQFPMAYVVRKSGSTLSDKQVKDFVSKQGCQITELSSSLSDLRPADLRQSTAAAAILLTNHLQSSLQLQQHQESILEFARAERAEGQYARKRAADAEAPLTRAQEAMKVKNVELRQALDRAATLQAEKERVVESERKRAEEGEKRIAELESQLFARQVEANFERERAVEFKRRAEAGENNFAQLKKGIPGMITKVLGSKLVGDPYNDYVEAIVTHSISDAAHKVAHRLAKDQPLPPVVANLIRPGTLAVVKEAKDILMNLKIDIYDDVCNREESSAKDILDVNVV